MTNEEAIDVLKHNYPSTCFEDLCEAVEIAIKALSAQPENEKRTEESAQNVTNGDLISRKMAIEEIFNADLQIYEGDWTVGRRNYMTKEEACSIIDSLPSAQSEVDCQKCVFCGFAGFKQF